MSLMLCDAKYLRSKYKLFCYIFASLYGLYICFLPCNGLSFYFSIFLCSYLVFIILGIFVLSATSSLFEHELAYKYIHKLNVNFLKSVVSLHLCDSHQFWLMFKWHRTLTLTLSLVGMIWIHSPFEWSKRFYIFMSF